MLSGISLHHLTGEEGPPLIQQPQTSWKMDAMGRGAVDGDDEQQTAASGVERCKI